MRVPVRNRGKLSGFTLVEMAIVLVIIGIILAGVMKGRDIVRGSQIKQFSQQFAQKWATIASTYYDKTGQFLMDGAPNGGSTGTDPDGRMDGIMFTAAGNGKTLVDTLNNVGISACSLVKSKLTQGVAFGVTPTAMCGGSGTAGTTDRLNIVQNQVDGEYAQGAVVGVDLVGLDVTIPGTIAQTYRRNCVALYGVPVDVAIGLDTVIDGTANGLLGTCVYDSTSGVKDSTGSGTANGVDLSVGTAITTGAWPAALKAADNTPELVNVILILDY